MKLNKVSEVKPDYAKKVLIIKENGEKFFSSYHTRTLYDLNHTYYYWQEFNGVSPHDVNDEDLWIYSKDLFKDQNNYI